jgi:AcrR family transcriptional regulator
MHWVEASMDQPLSRRERKKLETRQRLLEAAWTLFREKGYSATTVEEITDGADVAKGTFFNYFPSKEALLEELSVWRVEQLRAALDVSQGAPASPLARIKMLMQLRHEQVAQDMRLFRRAFATHLTSPLPPPHRAKHQVFGLLTELVREAQACGQIRADLEAELVGDLLQIAFFRQMIAGHDGGGDPRPVAPFERLVDLLMDGLAGPNWRRA